MMYTSNEKKALPPETIHSNGVTPSKTIAKQQKTSEGVEETDKAVGILRLSTELFMMAHRLSDEEPVPADFPHTKTGRRVIRVYRVLQGRVVARITNIGLPVLYFFVVAWLPRQRTMQGVYKSATDIGMAFTAVYTNMFLMLHRSALLAKVREAAVIARDLEALLEPKQMDDDVKRTVHLMEVLYAGGVTHTFVLFLLFLAPTLWTGESPFPIVVRDQYPLYFRYMLYIFQDVNVSIGESCLMLMEYIHIGSTLAASLMYRMLSTRFESSHRNLTDKDLRHLVTIHQRLIENTASLQSQFSGHVLFMMGGIIIGLIASTLSIMDRNTEAYVYLIMPSCMIYIASKCAAGDSLICWSRELADRVYACPWINRSSSFRRTATLVILRAQKPQVLFARYVGALDMPTARNIFNRWYTFVQYLQNGAN